MKSSLLAITCKPIRSLLAAVLVVPFLPAAAAPPSLGQITIHQLADRRMIIEGAPAIELPAPPEPLARATPEPQSQARLAELAAKWRADREANPAIFAGATVYHLLDGTTVTHVTHWRVNNDPPVSFWSSIDLSLLAHPGVFASPDQRTRYSMMLMWSAHDARRRADFMASRDRLYQQPEVPLLPNDPPTWMLDGTPDQPLINATTHASIEHLHQYYHLHHSELLATYQAIQAKNAARRAELEANPPQPRDIHLRVSRLTPEQSAAWHHHHTQRQRGQP